MTKYELLARPASELLSDFGAGRATPGSGSAAALNGLLAAQLIKTVCLKSEQKFVSERPTARICFVKDQVAGIEQQLKDLFQKDSDEFQKVVDLRMQRDSEKDRDKGRLLARQSFDALEGLTPTVVAIAENCLKLAEYGHAVFEDGWEHIRGDAGAAMSSAISGAMSCAFVLCLNAKTLSRRVGARKIIDECERLEDRIQQGQRMIQACLASLHGEANTSIEASLQTLPLSRERLTASRSGTPE